MAEATFTVSPGKVYGQEYASRAPRVFSVVFDNLQTLTHTPTFSGTPASVRMYPGLRVTSGDNGSSGVHSAGTYSFLSAGTTTGRLYWFGDGSLVQGTATTFTPLDPASDIQRRILGARHRFFSSASVADTNTWTSGIEGIIDFAFVSPLISCGVTESAGVFTFSVTSGPALDLGLHVWSES